MDGKSHFERTGHLCRKIDVYRKGVAGKPAEYLHSTNWHRTCRAAVLAIANAEGVSPGQFFARFSK